MANGILQGKRGIISGALDENSIAWKVALKAKAEGATIISGLFPMSQNLTHTTDSPFGATLCL
jgi:enoyl-[acyl-carrier protein] reductase I